MIDIFLSKKGGTMRRKVQALILMVLLTLLLENAKVVANAEENAVLEKMGVENLVETEALEQKLTAGVSRELTPTLIDYSILLEDATIVAPERKIVQSANLEETDKEVKEDEEAIQEMENLETEQSEEIANEEIKEQLDMMIEKDVHLLAKGIHGEAGNCDNDEKYRVGTVIMNRVERKDHPKYFKNDIEGVLKAGYDCYQNEQWFAEEPTEEEIEIARDILIDGTRVFDITVVFQMKNCPYGEVVYKSHWHEYGSLPITQ